MKIVVTLFRCRGSLEYETAQLESSGEELGNQ